MERAAYARPCAAMTRALSVSRKEWISTHGRARHILRDFARLATPDSATTALRLRLPELPEQTRFSHCCRHYDHFGARWPDPLSKPNKPPEPSRLAATHP